MTDLKRTIEEGAGRLWDGEWGHPEAELAEIRAYGIACAKAMLEMVEQEEGPCYEARALLASLDSAREGRGEQREQEKP